MRLRDWIWIALGASSPWVRLAVLVYYGGAVVLMVVIALVTVGLIMGAAR